MKFFIIKKKWYFFTRVMFAKCLPSKKKKKFLENVVAETQL